MPEKRISWTIVTALVVGIAFGAGYVASQRRGESPAQGGVQLLATADGAVVIPWKDAYYVLGAVDSTGQNRLNDVLIFAFLLSQAEDAGIQEAASALGFNGPVVTLKEGKPDEVPPNP